jgi:hypothetical protein
MSVIRMLLLSILIVSLAAIGCSKSSTSEASSESSSNSSSSSSGSSSASSGNTAYINDVRDYTAEWVLSGGDPAAFKRRVSEIATKGGITDWEQDEATYTGIGRGLKKAGLSGDRLTQVSTELSGSDPQRAEWVKKGYDAEKIK